MFNPNKAPQNKTEELPKQEINQTEISPDLNEELQKINTLVEETKALDLEKIKKLLENPEARINLGKKIEKLVEYLKPLEKYIPAIAVGIATLTALVYAILHPGDPYIDEGITKGLAASMVSGVGMVGTMLYTLFIKDMSKLDKENNKESFA